MVHSASGLAKWAIRTAVLLTVGCLAGAADFSFSTIIRAGSLFSGQWELGIGPLGNPAAVQGQVGLFNYFPNGGPAPFQIRYTRATNRVELRYNGGSPIVYAPGGAGLAPGSVWTIPAGSLFVSALPLPVNTAVSITGLTLGGGVTVLQPFSTTTLTAAQSGSGSAASLGSPVVFRTGASGDWLLSGSIAFTGLRIYTFPLFNGAAGSDLSMGAGISGSDIPEPSTWLLSLAGVSLLLGGRAVWKRRPVRG